LAELVTVLPLLLKPKTEGTFFTSAQSQWGHRGAGEEENISFSNFSSHSLQTNSYIGIYSKPVT
jgi:hypothetical protein